MLGFVATAIEIFRDLFFSFAFFLNFLETEVHFIRVWCVCWLFHYVPMWMAHIVEHRWGFSSVRKTTSQREKVFAMNFERDALNWVD